MAPHRPASGRAGALLQRGDGHRQGGRRFPRRAAGGHDLRLRQQFDRPHRSRSPAPPARWCGARRTRARATWCGGCSPTSRPTSTFWSTAMPPTTRRSARAMIARLIEDRLDMVVAARVEQEARLIAPAIAPATGCSPASSPRCSSATLHRHPVRLSRVLAPVREVVSGAVAGVRDRDRACPFTRSSSICRWARSRRPIMRGRKDRRRSSAPGATACASCPPSSGSTARSGRWRSSPRIGIALAIVSVVLAIPIFVTYFEEGIVPRIPTAILSTGLMLLAFLSIVAGLVLDTVTRGRREMKLIAYLQHRRPRSAGPRDV